MTEINKLKKGDLFTKNNTENAKVYVYEGYCRFNKKYQYNGMNDDISNCYYMKKSTLVNKL